MPNEPGFSTGMCSSQRPETSLSCVMFCCVSLKTRFFSVTTVRRARRYADIEKQYSQRLMKLVANTRSNISKIGSTPRDVGCVSRARYCARCCRQASDTLHSTSNDAWEATLNSVEKVRALQSCALCVTAPAARRPWWHQCCLRESDSAELTLSVP